MKNLFLVHTQFQLFVAQQLIRQEELKHNDLLYSFFDDNYENIDVYDIILQPEKWENTRFVAALSLLGHIRRSSFWSVHKRLEWLINYVFDNGYDTIYIGDILNPGCQLIAEALIKRHYRVVFFEEGNNHYVGLEPPVKVWLKRLLTPLADIFVFNPLYGVKYAKRYFNLADSPHKMKGLYRKYNIIPQYHEAFDRQLFIISDFSDKLNEMIEADIPSKFAASLNLELLLTQPFYKDDAHTPMECSIASLRSYVKSVRRDNCIAVKYHPADTADFKKEVEKMLDSEGVKYVVLGRKWNLPAEYYLMKYRFKTIVTYYSSASHYNGYLYPKTRIVCLMSNYLSYCRKYGYPQDEKWQSFIDMANQAGVEMFE